MTTMIEKVAKGIARCNCNAFTQTQISIDLYVEKRWKDYVFQARIAIEAMAEPSDLMITRGSEKARVWDPVYGSDRAEAEVVYRAMLAAALSEEKAE